MCFIVLFCFVSLIAEDRKILDRERGSMKIRQLQNSQLEKSSCYGNNYSQAYLMRFNQAKCKVLHVGRGNSKHKHGLGAEWIERSPEERGLGVLGVRSWP